MRQQHDEAIDDEAQQHDVAQQQRPTAAATHFDPEHPPRPSLTPPRCATHARTFCRTASARSNSGSASLHRSCALMHRARLAMELAVLGWSGPNTCGGQRRAQRGGRIGWG